MDIEGELINALQKVAALEVKTEICDVNINGLGKVLRAEIESNKKSIAKLEKLVLSAQLYILACISVIGVVAAVVGFIITAYGIRLEDVFMVGKR